GRSGHEEHAVGLADRMPDVDERLLLEAEAVEAERQVARVENSKDDLLAVDDRQSRDAEVDRAPAHLELELAVLRLSLLRDVEAAHDLDAARDRAHELLRRRESLLENSVHPV